MQHAGLTASIRSLAAAIAGVLILSVAFPGVPARLGAAPEQETRALWVLRTSLTTQVSIATLVKSAREHGFNTLLVQVRGRGDAYFNDGIEPRAAELFRQPAAFDPLATVIEAGHDAGLQVHAWVNVNLIANAADLPTAREHLVHRHPDWLMVPRDIAQELAAIPFDSPAYLGKLARWTRAKSDDIEGLYASPVIPAAAEHTQALVRDLAKRYALDGVHLDYARYPNDRFDYSRAAISEFRASVRPQLTEVVRRGLDERESVDLFAYPDALPDDWRRFRIARLTALISQLRGVVKAEIPDAVVTVATAPDVREAYEHRLQDWSTWLEKGLVDGICPMAYTTNPQHFGEQIAAARAAAGDRAVWAGIGAYRLSPAQTIDNIQTARRLGAAGVVLFSYDSLIDPKVSSPDYLAVVGRAAFTPAAASPGSR